MVEYEDREDDPAEEEMSTGEDLMEDMMSGLQVQWV
jgi:hypothetical protein